MADPLVRRFRMSVLQTATILEFVQQLPSAASPMLRRIASTSGYHRLYRQVGTTGRLDPRLGVSVPWHVPPEEQPFWSYYLGKDRVTRVSEDRAWNSAVPLRSGLTSRLLASLEPSMVDETVDEVREVAVSYLYPHGVACTIEFDVRGRFTPVDVTRVAYRLRGLDGPIDTNGALRDGLRWASERAVATFEAVELNPPFTVVTVVEGTVPDGFELPGSPTHRAMAALTDWREHWQHHRPDAASLAQSIVPYEGEPLSQVIMAAPRGRVIWFPLDFSEMAAGGSAGRRASELHVETVLGSLQVDSLADLVDRSLPSPNWTSLQQKRVAGAIVMLRALFHRVRGLRNHSFRRQIIDNGHADRLNEAERRLGRHPVTFV